MEAKRYAILVEDLASLNAKTAVGMLRYSPHEVLCVVDRLNAGKTTDAVVAAVPAVAIVPDLEAALALEPDTLLVGMAFVGGGLPQEWRPVLAEALRAGVDLEAGLHVMLGEDPLLVEAATEGGAEIRDLRRPPDDIPVGSGLALDVDARVVLTMAGDCAIGKMTVALEMVEAATQRGIRAAFAPTGQTGIAIAGWGIAVDRVISDFLSGAAERLVLEAAERADLIVVEGQGALNHLAYSGVTLGLMHGAAPHAMVLCHEPGRTMLGDFTDIPIPPLEEVVRLNEFAAAQVRPAKVEAIALDTRRLEEEAARRSIEDHRALLGLPCTDPVRFDAGDLVDAVMAG